MKPLEKNTALPRETIREAFQKREQSFLSPFGTSSTHARRKVEDAQEDTLRTPFQMDRDRISIPMRFGA